jgi:hypothetical protein
MPKQHEGRPMLWACMLEGKRCATAAHASGGVHSGGVGVGSTASTTCCVSLRDVSSLHATLLRPVLLQIHTQLPRRWPPSHVAPLPAAAAAAALPPHQEQDLQDHVLVHSSAVIPGGIRDEAICSTAQHRTAQHDTAQHRLAVSTAAPGRTCSVGCECSSVVHRPTACRGLVLCMSVLQCRRVSREALIVDGPSGHCSLMTLQRSCLGT